MKNKYRLTFIVLLVFKVQSSTAATLAYKGTIALSNKPKECVVYKEGDKCYANAIIKWKASETGSFCLSRAPGDVKLACWNNANEGGFSEKLVMDGPVEYYLTPTDSSEKLLKETLNLSWVHKKSNRPEHTWRIF
ncbi:MAG: DUF3019 domain-containing protein [Gammaproteobacteria bacterium]|nr:MAG: DUF3019 domain-containing protein [Gammaproteobacteria bacterium]